MLPIYPQDDARSSGKLLATLGNYWSQYFRDAAVLETIMYSGTLMYDATAQRYDEAVATLSRETVPLDHQVPLMPFILSDAPVSADASPLTYQVNGAVYGAPGNPPYSRVFRYGEAVASGSNAVYSVDPALLSCRVFTNRLTNPTVTLVQGVDFTIDRSTSTLTFTRLPVSSELTSRPRVTPAGVVYTEFVLFGYDVRYDESRVYLQYGYPAKLPAAASTPQYRDAVNAVYDSHQSGPNYAALRQYMAAAYDVPVSRVDGEKVVDIVVGSDMLILTDHNVYRANAASTAIVTVGQVLEAGDFLVDTVQFYDPRFVPELPAAYRSNIIDTVVYEDAAPVPDDARSSSYPRTEVASGTWSPDRYVGPDQGYGRRSLRGLFVNDDVTLTIPILPAHRALRLSFDIVTAGDWQGAVGAAAIEVLIDGVRQTFTDFSNDTTKPQSYPETRGAAQPQPAHTGANVSELASGGVWPYRVSRGIVVQGTTQISGPGFTAARYEITGTVPHGKSDVVVTFRGTGLTTDAWYVNRTDHPADLGFIGAGSYFVGRFTTAEFVARFGWVPSYTGAGNVAQRLFYRDEAIAVARQQFGDEYVNLMLTSPGTIVVLPNPDGSFSQQYSNPLTDFIENYVESHVVEEDRGVVAFPAQFWALQHVKVETVVATRTKLLKYPVDLEATVPLYGVTASFGLLKGPYFGAISLPNRDVAVTVTQDTAGRTVVEFEVGGYPGDIDSFWDAVHAYGCRQGYTLANYLDTRPNAYGEPGAADLPATVNPMNLLLRYLSGYNMLVVKVRRGLEGSAALVNDVDSGARMLDVLRRITLPGTMLLLAQEIVVGETVIDFPCWDEVSGGQGPVVTSGTDAVAQDKPYATYVLETVV